MIKKTLILSLALSFLIVFVILFPVGYFSFSMLLSDFGAFLFLLAYYLIFVLIFFLPIFGIFFSAVRLIQKIKQKKIGKAILFGILLFALFLLLHSIIFTRSIPQLMQSN